MRKFVTMLGFVFFIFPSIVYSDIGYVYKGDINNDGIIDSIKSGPLELFGKGNGPFVLRLSKMDGSFNSSLITLNINGFSLEKNPTVNKIWSYMPFGAAEGVLQSTSLDVNLSMVNIRLYIGTNSSDIGKKFMDAVFQEKYLIKFNQVDNYIYPPHPCGVQWGKGC